jgi:alkylated DNA repair dioxygenase AlkB
MTMHTLFPLTPVYPEGFIYVPDFISAVEENDLCQTIEALPLHTMIFQGFEAKRKVASFGFDWSFDTRKLSKGKEIPGAFHFILDKVAAFLSLQASQFAELLVTEYPPGSVINWHRDAPPFHLIAGISLLSDCTFRLRPQEKARQNRSAIISFPVLRRSLYVMQGPSRTAWQHSISPVKNLRYSITLRTLKSGSLLPG